jgi:uncharacterized delta-60 repeat protein
VRGYFEEVTSLLIVDNLLVAGGWNPIMYFDAKPMDHDARIYLMQAASGAFANYESFEGKPTDVWALARRTDGKVMAGGSFIKEDNIDNSDYFPGLYLFTPPNFGTDQAFKPIVGGQANLSSLAVQDDGKILAAGEFYRANGLLFNGLARLSIDGSLDLAFTPADYPTYRINLRPDQKIIASGRYGVNGQDNSDLALLNPDGSVGSRGIAGNVTSLVAQPDLKVVLTSNWSPGVSRFNSDLTPDTVFSSNRGSGITNFQSPDLEFDRVNTSVLQGTNIIAGGSFSTFSGITVHNLVRLKSDGKFDNSFVLLPFTVFNFRSEVFALAVQPDNKVLVGGRFSTVGGVSDPSLVRLNPDGSLDTSFHSPFADAGATVYALALQPDGKILVGGTIQFVEGSNVYNSFVRLNADGSRDTTFNASVHGAVHTLAFETPNAVLLGGSFDAVDGQPRQGLARYIVTLLLPTVDSNYLNGAPGSFFTLHATNFAPGADLTISVNNHDLGDVQADTAGAVSFVLDATQADPGPYICRLRTKGTLGVYATQAVESAQILIDVRTGYPVRSKEAGPDVFGIPAGIAGSSVYLPVMIR